MARRRDNPLFPNSFALPWSLAIVIAGLVYACLRLFLLGYPAGSPLASILTTLLRANLGLALLAIGVAAFCRLGKWARGPGRACSPVDLGAIRALPWAEFKAWCADGFRALGYRVQSEEDRVWTRNADLVLRRGQEIALVHCSRWRSLHVGVKEIRDLYETVMAANAQRGIFVTSGAYSGAAIVFAQGKALELVDGERLAQLLAATHPCSNDRDHGVPQSLSADARSVPYLDSAVPHECPRPTFAVGQRPHALRSSRSDKPDSDGLHARLYSMPDTVVIGAAAGTPVLDPETTDTDAPRHPARKRKTAIRNW